MKTAISVPSNTFERVERATARLGISRSEFFTRAANKWLLELEGQDVTEAINRALDGANQDDDLLFVRAAAHKLAAARQWE